MQKINVNLFSACLAKKMRMYEIARLAGINNSRFSKILNGKMKATADEKRKLSKILGKTQKVLFQNAH